ncbi:DUF481 domain-containing protein [Shewanella litorisediminis]|uniref:DUF481 domain-containing protein n=1 Tax=Shewanella litorisediminis TaxID=1173586 RepID=A0ABX7G1U9_9GAMM|nr:DUF481 domain-containing protein [Shewanella litorisediminis]MCL2918456.1 DUF481 domain-containing protein [Shewanella litorisediminis]QRH01289.1 DUF481 domain-containing protein [Shewanella litorisediminis]
MINKRILSIGCLLLSLKAQALVPPQYQEPATGLTAEVEAGLQLNTGNTQSTSFNGRTKLVYDTKKAKQEALLKAYFASDAEKTTAEKYDVQLQSNYKVESGYFFGRGEGTWDEFGSYTRLYTGSVGYGFDAISSYATKLKLEIGPGYQYSLAKATTSEPEPDANTDVILRAAAKFEQRIHEYSSFTADLTAETGQNNSAVILDMGYKNILFQDLAFKVGMNVKYTEVVPDGTEQVDTVTTFNLLYTFQ